MCGKGTVLGDYPNPLRDIVQRRVASYVPLRGVMLSGLDPSMLIGFLSTTKADWMDFRRRVAEVRSVQYEKRCNTKLPGTAVIQESQNDILYRR
jgi:hypothetical protein